MSDQKPELKPCPFCGKEAMILEDATEHGVSKHFYTGQCRHCDAESDCSFMLQQAIDNWNHRPIEDAMNERIAELEIGLKVTTRDNSMIEETCSNFEQQLADMTGCCFKRSSEANRGNLEREGFILDCILQARLNHDGYEWSLSSGIYRIYKNNDPVNQKNHVAGFTTFGAFINWLIEQGVDE